MSDEFHKVVFRFLIYRVISRFSFYVPIFIIALLNAKFSFKEIGWFLFIYGISTMFFSRFSQFILNIKGAQYGIFYGELLKFFSNIIIAFSLLQGDKLGSSLMFLSLCLAQILGGAGYCFSAVGDGNYLSSFANAKHIPKEMQTLAQAKSSSYMFVSFLVTGCIGAVTFLIMPSLPFF